MTSDGDKMTLSNGTPVLSIAKLPWEDRQRKSSPCKLIPSALAGFFSKTLTHRHLRWHTQYFSQQLFKFFCSITHTNVRVERVEWTVGKKRSQFMQYKSGIKCPQPKLKELRLQSV